MQQSNNTTGLTNLYLHVSLNNIEIRHNDTFKDIYFSFIHRDKFHFSSAISSKTSYINDDFFLFFQTEQQIPETLKIQRWENHMILLQHQIDIEELRGRNYTKKKVQTKQNQIISLSINLFNNQQIRFFNAPIDQIMQHYLKIHKIRIQDPNKQDNNGLSYFEFVTKQQKYLIPVINSELIIQLPCFIQISYFKNDQLFGRSSEFSVQELGSRSVQVGLYDQNGNYASKLKLHFQWGSNLSYRKLQSNLLYEAHEICIYDIQVKFQNFAEFANAKLKIYYGTKVYELDGQLNHRVAFFQRILYIILKSQEEQVSVICQRNNKCIAQTKFSTAQMLSHKISNVKKLFTDPVSHRNLGYIKFSCQKAKNLSLPSSNTFWKECIKKKSSTNLMLQIQQLSVYSQSQKQLVAIVKTEKQQQIIQSIINFQYFQLENSIHEPAVISIQQSSSIYIVIKQKQEQNSPQNEFIGIASLNYEQLRLGVNSVKILFYKNQVQTLHANCIINKVVPYPFVKGYSHPQLPLHHQIKAFAVSISVQKIQFYPYFLTYQYQMKNEKYCIFQIGKTKKVVILQSASYNQLALELSAGSDNLSFNLLQSDFIKGKMIFLVSQLGKEEQIYGSAIIRLKTANFLQNSSQKLNNLEIRNQYGICIGVVSIQIKAGQNNQSQMLSGKQLKKIRNDMVKVNESIQKMQRNLSRNKTLQTQNKSNILQNKSRIVSNKSIVVENKREAIKRKNQGKQKINPQKQGIKSNRLSINQHKQSINAQIQNKKKDKIKLPVRYVSKKKYEIQDIKLPKI